jgi:hypothetical protein
VPIERGIIRPADLVDQVNQQVKQIILTCSPGGTHLSVHWVRCPADHSLSMTTASVILDGVGALDWQAIRKVFPRPKPCSGRQRRRPGSFASPT